MIKMHFTLDINDVLPLSLWCTNGVPHVPPPSQGRLPHLPPLGRELSGGQPSSSTRRTPPRSQRFARSPSGLAGSGAPSRRSGISVGGGGATLHPPSLDLGTRPGSEHALAAWLEDFYVCNAAGSRWQAQWKAWRRVKVSFEQLKLWYQTLDDLLPEKGRIEKELYFRLRDLFSLQPDLVFYDLTSTYFEGQGPAELARCGYSRDSKTPSSPDSARGGDDGGLADGPPCLCR